MCGIYPQFISSFALVVLALTVDAAAAATLHNYTVLNFLRDVQRFHGFDNVLIVHNQNATLAGSFINAVGAVADSSTSSDSDTNNTLLDAVNAASETAEAQFIKRIVLQLQVPVLLLNERATFQLKKHFSFGLMSLVYVDGALLADHNGLLKTFVASLYHMTQTKILFLLNYPAFDERLLTQLFQFCWSYKIINVAALFADYQYTATFYSYTHFPGFELETKRIYVDLLNREEIYPYRLGNLRGYKLPYIIGGSDPRIIVYKTQKDGLVVGGFVGHFLKSFAQKFNCTLYEPLPAKSNAFAPSQELIAAVRNGTVDISAGLTFPTIPFAGFTYPYEQLNWCLMMPMEADIPAYDFYWIVFEGATFLITLGMLVLISMVLSTALYQSGYKPDLMDFVLHGNCLRGVLGQSFTEIPHPRLNIRFIYLQICVLGILLTTTFNSYFSTYVTSAPKVPPLRTFEDIVQSGKKVIAWAPEYNELLGRNVEFRKYTSMFYIEPNYQRYLQSRDSFDTKYGYMMPSTKWVIVNEQQKIFTTPIFRNRDDLCFYFNVPMCFPVQDNSLFVELLYQMILETSQSGLTDFWRQNGFLELINAGKLSFADLSQKNQFEAMKVEDLKYIWMGFGVMSVVVTLVFVLEQFWFHRRPIWAYLKRKYLRWCCGRRSAIKWNWSKM